MRAHPAIVARLLRYDAASGKLFWLPRDETLCARSQDAVRFNKLLAGKEALTSVDRCGYKHGFLLGRHCFAHRAAWAIAHGEWPTVVDHVNGNPADNRLINLRNVSNAENSRNMRKATKTLGVRFCTRSQKWLARIRFNYRHIHIGYFSTEEEAIAARMSAQAKYGFHPLHGAEK